MAWAILPRGFGPQGKKEIEWNGEIGLASYSTPYKGLVEASIGGVYLHATSEKIQGMQTEAHYAGIIFGFSISSTIKNLSGIIGTFKVFTPGIFGVKGSALSGPFSMASLSGVTGAGYSATGFIIGTGVGSFSFNKGPAVGFDLGLDLMSGVGVVVSENKK